MPRRGTFAVVTMLSALLTAACGPKGSGKKAEPPPPFRYSPDVAAAEYYPLEVGASWTFAITSPGDSEAGEVISPQRVTAVDGNRVTLAMGGKAIVYLLESDGILTSDGRTYLLKGPIVVGTTWEMPGDGGTSSIDAIDVELETRAGSFQDCVIVRGRTGPQEVVTTYCPRVGPVLLEHRLHPADAEPVVMRRAELVAFRRDGVVAEAGATTTSLEKVED